MSRQTRNDSAGGGKTEGRSPVPSRDDRRERDSAPTNPFAEREADADALLELATGEFQRETLEGISKPTRAAERDALRQVHRIDDEGRTTSRFTALALPEDIEEERTSATPPLGLPSVTFPRMSVMPRSGPSSHPAPSAMPRNTLIPADQNAHDAWSSERSKRDTREHTLLEMDSAPEPVKTVDPVEEIEVLFRLHDFSGVLHMAQNLVPPIPERLAPIIAECRARLFDMLASRVGSFAQRPEVIASEADMHWLGIDNRAAFLLSRIDGATSVDDLFDLSGMPKVDVLQQIIVLLEAGAIRLRPA